MGRSNRAARAPREFEIAIDGLGHDGRGVGRVDGKAVFVSGALPGETVRAKQTGRNRHFDEAETIEVLVASPLRVAPRCPHFGVCSGCVLRSLGQTGAGPPHDPGARLSAFVRAINSCVNRITHVLRNRRYLPIRGITCASTSVYNRRDDIGFGYGFVAQGQ